MVEEAASGRQPFHLRFEKPDDAPLRAACSVESGTSVRSTTSGPWGAPRPGAVPHVKGKFMTPHRPSLTPESVVQARPEPLAAEVGDELALLSLPQGRYHGLNATGAFVWQQIREPIQVRELVTRMLGAYEVDQRECQDDLLELLGQMNAAGLIEVRDAGPATTCETPGA